MNEPRRPAAERRVKPRYSVEGPATLFLVNQDTGYSCQIIDLSESGCRISTDRPFLQDEEAQVEVAFKVKGIAFRLSGRTEWLREHHLLGVHFTALSPRRKDDLLSLLEELRLESEANPDELPEPSELTIRHLSTSDAAEEESPSGRVKPARRQPIPFPRPSGPNRTPLQGLPVTSAPVAGPPRGGRERRAQARHTVDSRASILLLDLASRKDGRILDVSLGGCSIRSDERFPVGIYRRIEVGFTLDGLPFRLPGVIQSVHDRFTVGIRFLDVSDRKREQLQELIGEIEEMRREGTL